MWFGNACTQLQRKLSSNNWKSKSSMKFFVLYVFATVGLIAQPALANYPCPGGPGPGEQQIGVGGGSHGIAAVPLCVATGGGSDSGGIRRIAGSARGSS